MPPTVQRIVIEDIVASSICEVFHRDPYLSDLEANLKAYFLQLPTNWDEFCALAERASAEILECFTHDVALGALGLKFVIPCAVAVRTHGLS